VADMEPGGNWVSGGDELSGIIWGVSCITGSIKGMSERD
jgi:hypothetical protein